jgi:hypothetical protein
MMSRISFFLFFLFALCLISCKSLENLSFSKLPMDPLCCSNINLLNGTYFNNPDSFSDKVFISEPPSIQDIGLFNKMLFRKFNLGNVANQKINICFLSKNKINLTLSEQDTTVVSWTINGKFKSGYFYGRQKYVVIPFIPLLWGYRFQRFRIGSSGEYLILNFRTNQWAAGPFFGYSENGTFSAIYKKLKE